ncbi:hypothetical protein F5888DRAFT_1110589 [Russula emetica]|nr:hypothetical protein F5888DRAFT_1110589 [Russula emetica]
MPSSIKPSAAFYLTLVLAAGQRALAVNDWSVPCTQGKCSWDVPAESGASGSVQISGPVSAISDITPAAGWQIMTTCNPTSSQQNIQLMCENNNPDCNHLFQGNGAVNTIVRLPESCGPMPFARVAQHQVLESNLVTRGNGSEAPVHQLTLDTDFAAAGPSQGGDVNFSLQGQNKPDGSNTVDRRNHRRSRPLARLSIGSFNKTLAATPAPVNFSGQKNLFSQGSGSIDINADLQASVGISAVAAGSIIPPKVTQFGITFGLDGNADATLSVTGDISGQISSGNITLFQVGIPGLSIPKIFEIGPEFTLLGAVDANFGLQNVNASVDVNYDLSGASFSFPPGSSGSNTGGIASSSKQVTFSANPDVGATLGATAHLIPQVSLGINALDGVASASVFLDLDASLGLQGSISSAANPQPCLAGNADINVGVGAQGSFFGLFSASSGKSLFDKNFPLFQQCFGGNANSTNSTASNATATDSASQASATNATATDSASQTSATNATATDSASQTSATNATATDSASQTSATNATATDSASQTSATNATATDSASQTSATNATTTDSASQTSATNATATDSASQTSATNATATDSSSQTDGGDATATDSASQTSATNATATDSNSQTDATDATAASGSRRHYDAPRAIRHSARFRRSYFALPAEHDSDLSRL